MSHAKPIAAILAALGAAAVLAGCSVELGEAPPPAPPPLTAPPTDASGRIVLPPGFPLPEDAVALEGIYAEKQLAVPVVVVEPQAAFEFWRRELGPAGYTVTSAELTGSAMGMKTYEIRYNGHGCRADSRIELLATQGVVRCELR